MTLEDQCVSLELAKKLKELGFPQDSLFWWCQEFWRGPEPYDDNGNLLVPYSILYYRDIYRYPDNRKVAAYTVAELGELLPKDIDYDVSKFGTRSLNLSVGKTIMNNSKGWYVMYSDPHPANKVPIYARHADTEVDARARMLIYLKENKLI